MQSGKSGPCGGMGRGALSGTDMEREWRAPVHTCSAHHVRVSQSPSSVLHLGRREKSCAFPHGCVSRRTVHGPPSYPKDRHPECAQGKKKKGNKQGKRRKRGIGGRGRGRERAREKGVYVLSFVLFPFFSPLFLFYAFPFPFSFLVRMWCTARSGMPGSRRYAVRSVWRWKTEASWGTDRRDVHGACATLTADASPTVTAGPQQRPSPWADSRGRRGAREPGQATPVACFRPHACQTHPSWLPCTGACRLLGEHGTQCGWQDRGASLLLPSARCLQPGGEK